MRDDDAAPDYLTRKQERIVLSRMSGLTLVECARESGVSVSAVRKMVARAVQAQGCREETAMWLRIAAGRIPLRPAATRRLNKLLDGRGRTASSSS